MSKSLGRFGEELHLLSLAHTFRRNLDLEAERFKDASERAVVFHPGKNFNGHTLAIIIGDEMIQ